MLMGGWTHCVTRIDWLCHPDKWFTSAVTAGVEQSEGILFLPFFLSLETFWDSLPIRTRRC